MLNLVFRFEDMLYKQISMRKARKLFADGKGFALCPSSLRPGAPWSPEYYLTNISIQEWKNSTFRMHGFAMSRDENERIAWERMYSNWVFYNTGAGMGNYARFYTATMPPNGAT